MSPPGPVALSTPCKLIAPGVAVKGTMSITKNELYFEIDEDDEDNKKIDPNVSTAWTLTLFSDCALCVCFMMK